MKLSLNSYDGTAYWSVIRKQAKEQVLGIFLKREGPSNLKHPFFLHSTFLLDDVQR